METALCKIYGALVENRKGDCTQAMQLDLSVAFDTVDVELLLADFSMQSIGEKVPQWFSTYLKQEVSRCSYENLTQKFGI